MPDLYELHISGGETATVNGFYSSHSFVLELSVTNLDVEGSANDLRIVASGSSSLELSKFAVHDANVKLSDGSFATINLDGRLDADVSGNSHLRYVGASTLGDINISGDSTVVEKEN